MKIVKLSRHILFEIFFNRKFFMEAVVQQQLIVLLERNDLYGKNIIVRI